MYDSYSKAIDLQITNIKNIMEASDTSKTSQARNQALIAMAMQIK